MAKDKPTLTADQIRDRAIGEFESQVSRQLSELPYAPYTVQVCTGKPPYLIRVGNAREPDFLAHKIDLLDEHTVWLIVTLVKGTLYNVPPPPPVVDLAEIERNTTALKQHVERLQGKLTEERCKGAGWEAQATKAEAKLAQIRLMSMAELKPPTEKSDYQLVIE